VDLWLNNPRAPLEASGTSGMKAGLNGVPSASILDGWWVEGYDGSNGWAFGPEHGSEESDAANPGAADDRDAESLYRALEESIVPLFYERDAEGVPHGWLRVVRRAMQTVTPAFSARRMMKEYMERMYLPSVTAPEVEPR
jgi:starch phosphorylase